MGECKKTYPHPQFPKNKDLRMYRLLATVVETNRHSASASWGYQSNATIDNADAFLAIDQRASLF